MKLSILIKALNEEAKIAGAIESSLASIARLVTAGMLHPREAEIIVADSLSSDRTVAIAQSFPIRIVQLANGTDRSCGAGAQLAFQHSRGEFVYLMDGDMRLHADFLPIALQAMQPGIAGIGGRVNDIESGNLEFRARAARAGNAFTSGNVDWLDCGGLYRRSAIAELGYLADRNLHSFEEMDLGLRLRAAGWRLERLPQTSVDHLTHSIGSYALLWRRLSSHYAMGSGEIIRAAWGKPHLPALLASHRMLRVCAFVVIWLGVMVATCVRWPDTTGALMVAMLALLPILLMGARRRSLRLGLYAVTSWLANSLGLMLGLLRPRIDPRTIIASHEIVALHAVSVSDSS